MEDSKGPTEDTNDEIKTSVNNAISNGLVAKTMHNNAGDTAMKEEHTDTMTKCVEKVAVVADNNGKVTADMENAMKGEDADNSQAEKVTRNNTQRMFSDDSLLYKINDVPPFAVLVSVAMQNILLGLGGSLTTAYFISDVICAADDHPIRAMLFCTTCFMTGLCTTLQSLIGVRLPIYQSVCSTFLVPLMQMRTNDRWNCKLQNERQHEMVNGTLTSIMTQDEIDSEMYVKLREMMGCLLLASLFEVVVGATGLVGLVVRYIGPLSIAVVVSLIGLSLYRIPMEYAKTHWGLTVLCTVLIVVSMLYLDRVQVPKPSLPTCGKMKKKQQDKQRLPLFQMFPVLFGIVITWIVCAVMTEAGYFSDDPKSTSYRARTDVRYDIIHGTPWFYFPYPGQFGLPLFNTTIFVGFLATVVSSIFETIGDYYAAANLCHAPPPTRSALNRGILLEGLGSLLSGAVGAGHATTSSTGNLVLLGVTKVASRSCLVATGIITMLLSVVGKLGGVLSTMPDPVVGGTMFVTFGIMCAIGIFTLKAVDLSSSRNLAIFGLSLYCGIVIPEWINQFPESIDFGNETANSVTKGFLGNPMCLGGIVAIFLDNTVKGTVEERGLHTRISTEFDPQFTLSRSEAYDLPGIHRITSSLPWLHRLPFIQRQKTTSHLPECIIPKDHSSHKM